jgi:hypothetical protein
VFTAIARHAIANLHGRFIDSGATEHLIIDRSGFTTYTPIPPLTITLGGQDSTVQAIGRGSVTFTSPVDGVAQSITLTDALHVPKAEANLVSLGRLVEKGATVKIDKAGTIRLFHTTKSS